LETFSASTGRPLARLNVQNVVERNGRRETGYHGLGGRYLYDDLFLPQTWNRAIDIALAQALVNLDSVAAPVGMVLVIEDGSFARSGTTIRATVARMTSRGDEYALSRWEVPMIFFDSWGRPQISCGPHDTGAGAFGPTLGSLGVGRRDRVDARSGSSLRNEIAAWAGALGLTDFELYIGGRERTLIQGVPGETPALVVAIRPSATSRSQSFSPSVTYTTRACCKSGNR
jgi:hypothetical protein